MGRRAKPNGRRRSPRRRLPPLRAILAAVGLTVAATAGAEAGDAASRREPSAGVATLALEPAHYRDPPRHRPRHHGRHHGERHRGHPHADHHHRGGPGYGPRGRYRLWPHDRLCRVWLPYRPPHLQPPPGPCKVLRWRVPPGGALYYF